MAMAACLRREPTIGSLGANVGPSVLAAGWLSLLPLPAGAAWPAAEAGGGDGAAAGPVDASVVFAAAGVLAGLMFLFSGGGIAVVATSSLRPAVLEKERDAMDIDGVAMARCC